MIKAALCTLVGHKVERKRVWHDNTDYRTDCQRCGAPLIREPSGWTVFDQASDDAKGRLPHPRDRGLR